MKITIIGAGAIGGWLAAGLLRHGQADVSLLARGATLASLQAHGLIYSDAQGEQRWPVRSSANAADLGPQDWVVMALKAPALVAMGPTLRDTLAPLLGPKTRVLTAMNGVPWWFLHGLGGDGAAPQATSLPTLLHSVDPAGHLSAAIAADRVSGCVVHASCHTPAPGHVHHHFGLGLIIGDASGGAGPDTQALVALLQGAGFEAKSTPRIQQDVWYKLWGNMTMNPLSAITGATTDRLLVDPDVRAFVSSIMLEARDIGARLGLPIAQEPEDRHAVTAKLGAFKTSMLQDVEAARETELDALVTAVQELGCVCGIPTPYTDALLGLARVRLQTLGLYGQMSGAA
jgi:2-dehydropantoate 2-reductase